MKKRYYFLGILLVLLAFFIDKYVAGLFSKINYNPLTNFMAYFTILGSGFVVLILMTIYLTFTKKDYLPKGWVALGLALLLAWIIKNLVARARPELGLIAETGFSFPSGHAAAVFSVYPLFLKLSKKFNYYWLIFAVLIIFSRLYLNVHYLSDVLAGGLIGLIIGDVVINSKLFNTNKR